MMPSLHLFGGIALPSYGLMLFISFVVGIFLFDYRLRRRKLLPDVLNYSRAWWGTDIFVSLVILAAGIWAAFYAPNQLGWLTRSPPAFKLTFRVAALICAGYLIYGSIGHILAYRRKRQIESVQFTTYLALWVLFSAIIGSRLLYIALHWSEFAHDLVGTFAFWRGGLQGLVFYGGFVGALVMGLVFARLNRMALLRMLDAAIPSVVLGEFFTRIGCFLNGCCFGKVCSLPWAIRFPENSPAGAFQAPIHPTQLYSSLAGLVLFVIALILERRDWRAGLFFGVVLLLYAVFRFGIDFVRYYENSANLWTNQLISVGLMAIAVAVIIISRRQSSPAAPAGSGTTT